MAGVKTMIHNLFVTKKEIRKILTLNNLKQSLYSDRYVKNELSPIMADTDSADLKKSSTLSPLAVTKVKQEVKVDGNEDVCI